MLSLRTTRTTSSSESRAPYSRVIRWLLTLLLPHQRRLRLRPGSIRPIPPRLQNRWTRTSQRRHLLPLALQIPRSPLLLRRRHREHDDSTSHDRLYRKLSSRPRQAATTSFHFLRCSPCRHRISRLRQRGGSSREYELEEDVWNDRKLGLEWRSIARNQAARQYCSLEGDQGSVLGDSRVSSSFCCCPERGARLTPFLANPPLSSLLEFRWPAFKRDSTWRTLLNNGVDWINADNLKAASQL